MNLDRLNQWAMVAANFSVLAGIIFLGVEIQQNTEMVRAQTRDAMTDKQMAYYELAINNIETDSLFRGNGSELEIDRNSIEYRKHMFLNLAQLRMWENEFYQYRQGLFEASEFESRLNVWENLMSGDSRAAQERRNIWNFQKDNFSSDFVLTLDTKIGQR